MKTTRQGYGSKILSSIIGAIIGVVLFLGSFVVLYLNEGRENIGAIANDAVSITQEEHNLEAGTLISLQGNLEAETYAADEFLQDGNYIILYRTVEMYAYVESEHSQTEDNLGGSSTTITTYSYSQKWTTSPKLASNFEGDSTELPQNIPAEYDQWISGMPNAATSKAQTLSMGRYSIGSGLNFSGEKRLALTTDIADTSSLDNSLISSNYIYKGNAGEISTTPKLGDIRISYNYIDASDSGVILGAIENDSITSFITPKNNKLLRFFAEASSREEAISILEREHNTMTWILRLVGWLLMFVGLIAMTGPVTKFLSVVPFFSRISGFIFGVAAFFISLILTGITIGLSMILHNFWLAMAFVILLIIIVITVISRKRAKAQE